MDTKLIDEADISYQSFLMPDFWYVIGGMRFGGDYPSSFVKLIWNRNLDIIYVPMAWKGSTTSPQVIWTKTRTWIRNVPVAWPADGLHQATNARDEKISNVEVYFDKGFDMLDAQATYWNRDTEVLTAISQIFELMRLGRLKVANHLVEVFDEIRPYYAELSPKGESRIIKGIDPILSAICYAFIMMPSNAIRICDLFPDPRNYKQKKAGKITGRDPITGY